jgi:eukaryotic-like serine/threonine-protein kinase
MKTIGPCPSCGNQLPPDAPAGLCPVCLLKSDPSANPAAKAKPGDSATTITVHPVTQSATAETQGEAESTGPKAQRQFGGYRIVRPLGRGGMGAVYEAEEIASGRRVALKVLSHSLNSATTRQRFLREGRLAASVNHPNSVYIFGTEEIEGQPVITMELAAGGTLQDRVKQSGPLAIPDAVDAILQVIAGLEAAARLGVLHRDVKPSNCFVEEDGTIKVGDFGLSISTLARPESNLTATGAFLGTPAYSSPEQLRGDELDVRSDIYAVGVTLYYLLTGKTPFTGENVVQLLAQVLERTPESPAKLRPELPKELSNVVLRCLAKLPAQRFRTYQELREALAPFASTTDTPAPVITRFCAGTLDVCVDATIQVLLLLFLLPKSLILSGTSDLNSPNPWFQTICSVIITVLYYGVPEGLWGASLGKAICNLRVLDPSRSVPGLARAFLRAALFAAAFDLPGNNVFYGSHRQLEPFAMLVFPLGLFVTARKANGWAGLHDLASKTRVVRKRATEVRRENQETKATMPQIEGSAQIGPYHVLSRMDESVRYELLLGYDTRLLRKVWIYKESDGAPLGIQRHALRRPTRLRWLNGQHTSEGSWDAYEAPTGEALMQSLHSPKPWERVRYWLHDLAQEMGAALKDSSLPPAVEMNRVWLTSDGRAKLLEFPAPGAVCAKGVPPPDEDSRSAPFGSNDAQLFLKQVAASALTGRPMSVAEIRQGPVTGVLPLSARNFLSQLPGFTDLDRMTAQLTPLLDQAAAISRARRLALMAACCLPATLLMAIVCFLLIFMQRYTAFLGDSEQGLVSLGYCVDRFEALEKAGQTDATQSEREALEIYIAARSKQMKTNEFISNALEKSKESKVRELNQIINQIQAKHPASSVQEVADATARLKPFLDACPAFPGGLIVQKFRAGLITMLPYGFALLIAVPSLIAALVCRGGLLVHALGVEFVAQDGAPASRWRLSARLLLVWSPILAGLVLSRVMNPFKADAVMLALFALGAVWVLLDPQRGLPERLVGIWSVPRGN